MTRALFVFGVAAASTALAAACGPSIVLEQGDTGGAAEPGATESTTAPVGDESPADDEPGLDESDPDQGAPDVGDDFDDDTTSDDDTPVPETTSNGDSNFFGPNDAGDPGVCDVYNDDCPAGHKCTFYGSEPNSGWDTTRCVELVDNPDGVGDPCQLNGGLTSGLDTCELGAMCWNVDADSNGTCVAFCAETGADLSCADPCASCSIAAASPLTLCFSACDVIAQDCPEGQGCYPANGSFTCMPDQSDGEGLAGEPCEFVNVCNPGTVCLPTEFYPSEACVGDGANDCCTPTCVVGDPTACPDAPDGVVCTQWYEEGKAPSGACGNGPELGICIVP